MQVWSAVNAWFWLNFSCGLLSKKVNNYCKITLIRHTWFEINEGLLYFLFYVSSIWLFVWEWEPYKLLERVFKPTVNRTYNTTCSNKGSHNGFSKTNSHVSYFFGNLCHLILRIIFNMSKHFFFNLKIKTYPIFTRTCLGQSIKLGN